MAEQIRIQTPFTEEMSRKLKAGDAVLISGEIIAARDAAHKAMTEALARGEKLPVDWQNQMVYYLGPTPAKPGDPIGSCGPTTSGRMDPYAPRLLDLGLAAMIGKGERAKPVQDAIVRNEAVYLCAVGGAGALAARCIKEMKVIAFEDLGCESVKRLRIEDFPLVVCNDAQGGDLFSQGRATYVQEQSHV